MTTPEQSARSTIDALLVAAGWAVQDAAAANIHAAQGVAIREFPLKSGHGFADDLLYVDGKAAGVIETKKEGVTLTGVETRFINGLDPAPCSRPVFPCHKPELLAEWPGSTRNHVQDASCSDVERGATFLARLQAMAPRKQDHLPDLYAKGGGRVLSRSTRPMASSHC